MAEVEPQYIDATATQYRDDDYQPSVAPQPITRAQVVTRIRILMAQAAGIGALVEQSLSRIRREFAENWWRWHGAAAGRGNWAERQFFDAEKMLEEVKKREAELQMWRTGLQMELQAHAPPTVGTAPPVEVRKPGVLANVPWWVLIPAGVGVAVGGYYGMRYIFRQWFAPAEETMQTVKRVTEFIPMGQGQAQAQPAPQP